MNQSKRLRFRGRK